MTTSQTGLSSPGSAGYPSSAGSAYANVPPGYQSPTGAPGQAATAAAARQAPPAKGRRARLVVSKVDPWSVMKLAFLLSFVGAVMFVVAVALLWEVLDGMGVFTSIADQVGSFTTDASGSGFDVLSYLSLNKVLGGAIVLALVDVVLLTALATLGAFVYNVSASLVGGLHVTLSEDS